MPRSDQPVVLGFAKLDDETLDMVTGGVSKSLSETGAVTAEEMAIIATLAAAQRAEAPQGRDAAKMTLLRELGEIKADAEPRAGQIGMLMVNAAAASGIGNNAGMRQQEAEAQLAISGAQIEKEMMQQMVDVIRDVRDKLRTIEQARVETNRGIARDI
jgi:hypothetical protein